MVKTLDIQFSSVFIKEVSLIHNTELITNIQHIEQTVAFAKNQTKQTIILNLS